jgi:hypothetical protein
VKRRLSASVWREDEWHVAWCLKVDAASQGASALEALDNLRAAAMRMRGHIDYSACTLVSC